MTFKELAELLLAGGYVQNDTGQRMHLSSNGDVVFDDCNGTSEVTERLLQPRLLKPFYFWYEDIPKQGIVCWVSNTSTSVKERLAVIISYDKANKYGLSTSSFTLYATPLTNDEIDQLKRPT